MPTIAAIATPPGRGGISIIRLSGPGSKSLIARVFLPHSARFENFRPWTLHHGAMLDSEDNPLDDVLAVFMPGPRTYTGEDMAEIHCHGGNLAANAVLDSFLRLGARLAEPGEFTRRAYLNGRMDLSQAEAVAELVSAPSREALAHGLARLEGALARHVLELKSALDELRALARVGVDFPEDEIEGLAPDEYAARVQACIDLVGGLLKGARRADMMAQGCQVALVGGVNVGKSSLLNALAGQDRALVTDIPGTTRDFIEAHIDLDGLPCRLVDTAGLRAGAGDAVESLGMAKSRELAAEAQLAVIVLAADAPVPLSPPMTLPHDRRMLLWNKTDLAPAPPEPPAWAQGWSVCAVSAKTGQNLDAWADAMRGLLLAESGSAAPEEFGAPNRRQTAALEKARGELGLLLADLAAGVPYDCCLTRLDTASRAVMDIVELAPDDELLDKIFSQFCIGK